MSPAIRPGRPPAAALGLLLAGLAGTAWAGPPGGTPITIGAFLPRRGPQSRIGREVLRGAEIAVERANRGGGVLGRPLRLSVGASESPWNGSAGELVRLIYDEGALAVFGALDARSAHLAEQVIARARGAAIFLTPWASEVTLTGLRIPWFFRLAPDDREQARVLAAAIFEGPEPRRVAAWIEDGFGARAAGRAFLRAAPAGLVETVPASTSRDLLGRRLRRGDFDALVLFGSARAAADLVVWLRRAGYRQELFGPLALARGDFLERAGAAAEGMRLVAPAASGAAAAAVDEFEREFERRHGERPYPPALYGHDAVLALSAALAAAGEGAGRMAESLARVSVTGLTGRVTFDGRLNRRADIRLAVVCGGRLRRRDGARGGCDR
ncbi:MAG: ABC transporter substrate-binding protein [Acidobacteriota bacterium]